MPGDGGGEQGEDRGAYEGSHLQGLTKVLNGYTTDQHLSWLLSWLLREGQKVENTPLQHDLSR